MNVWIDGSTTETCYIFQGEEPVVSPIAVKVTNNVGEYHALLKAFLVAKLKDVEVLSVYSDSELLVKQLTFDERGEPYYKCNNARLHCLKVSALAWMRRFEEVSLTWIPREENPAGLVLDRRKGHAKSAERTRSTKSTIK